MAKNGYLEKRSAMHQACLDAGLQTGRQQATDMFFLALADYEVIGNKKLKPEEIEKVLHKTEELMRLYHPAFTKDDEADYYQEKLDAELAVAVPEGKLVPFRNRYPYSKEFDYKKGRWK